MRLFRKVRKQDKDEAELKREKEIRRILKDHDAVPFLLRALIEIKNRSTGDNTPAVHAHQALLDWDKNRG